MFQGLIASQSRATQGGPSGAGLIALLGHGALVAAAILGTLRPTAPPAAIRVVPVTWPAPAEPNAPPLRTRVPAPGAPALDPTPVPVQVPLGLPPISPSRPFDPTEWLREPHAVVGVSRTTAGEGIWPAAVVEEPPVLLAGRAPSYPDALRAAGIAGRVVVQAVIDTLGRAEPGLTVIESAHTGFEAAALEYVRRAVFRAARVQGRPVRVLIRLPVDFRLTSGP
jgi:periplasmic protein TonB